MRNLLIIILSLFSLSGFAQRAEVFALGGLNGSTIKVGNSVSADYNRLYSPTFGVFGGIGSQYVLGEIGALYSTQGTKINSDEKIDIKLRYIDVPAMAVVAPENFRFFLGPQVSFLTSVEARDTIAVKSQFNKTAWALRFGAGYERKRLLLQLHFVNGLTNVLKESAKDQKTRTFQLSLGFLLFSNYGKLEGKRDKKKEDELIPSHRVID